jgi:putative FmdB family regulatory protein
MPLYEYECEGCARRFEVIRKFSDPPLEHCEVCGGKVRKLFSSPAIQFKGSGFYINDYARKSGDAAGGGSTANASAPAAAPSGTASSESAPASTPPPAKES